MIITISIPISYVFNFLPSIKYPDGTLEFYNLIFSILFLVSLLVLSFSLRNKILTYFFINGIFSGMLIFTFIYLERYFLGNLFFDILSSVYYIFYIIFITPFFGFNQILDVEITYLSLAISLIYVLLYFINQQALRNSHSTSNTRMHRFSKR